ncbi:AAA family ATPase [Neisseria sp. 74A18]|uniref:AAA family ATPase n=1 Tax=Neisseria sp. 74A18 TaxID=1696094 RepID=UPI0006CAE284|nr:ATP-binding protein [Neisseria sp. 74A18]KPN74156.1 hypothetical protein AKG43_04325 [Neisseria sp. 74A18]
MIYDLNLVNAGPSESLSLKFGERINIFTGDNGLGKSFLLDIIWWSLTRTWPHELNTYLDNGHIAKPFNNNKESTISFLIKGSTTGKKKEYTSKYNPKEEEWIGRPGRPVNPGLVIYIMADGSIALWDPLRNYWKQSSNIDTPNKIPAYIFTQKEIWNGKQNNALNYYFTGLLADWAIWQKGKSHEFEKLQNVLDVLSTPNEPLKIGNLGRISLEDERSIPSITMPYGKDVLLPHVSSGIKKIITLAYFLVYAWQKHLENANLLNEKPTNQITFIIDEIEAHLHPKWQRYIAPSILKIMESLNERANIQLFTATHSPLIMSSLEPYFDETKDQWFDLDLKKGKVTLENRLFEKKGSSDSWLLSEAFDLTSSRAPDFQKLIDEASKITATNEKPSKEYIDEIYKKLTESLDPKDPFLTRWRYICEKKGWITL